MLNKILFIGPINKGKSPAGGAEAKNQILLETIRKDTTNEINYLDVSKLKKNKILLTFTVCLKIIQHKKIVLSVASTALLKLAFLNLILVRKKVTIFVIGGMVHERLDNNRLKRLFENACIVYAETKELKQNILHKSAQINVQYLPNFKKIPNIKIIKTPIQQKVKLLYLSRIHSDKGIFRSIKIAKELNEKDFTREYELSIYGNFDLTKKEKLRFETEVEKNKNIIYKGFLDLEKSENYLELANYHFFLFLTNHYGEGFPGVLIDAMIAQVPVIASDWKYNSEILNDGNGIMGTIINLDKDDYIQQACGSILRLIANNEQYYNIQERMRLEVQQYNIDNIKIDLP